MKSRRWGMTGKGNDKGLPLRGTDGGRRRTGSLVWAGGSRTARTGRVGWMGKGAGDGFLPLREKRM